MTRRTRSAFRMNFALCLFCATAAQAQVTSRPTEVRRIAFGSCARQDKPQPIWEAIVAEKPDLFLMIGDNIYGDSEDLSVLRGKYDLLAAVPEFQKLRASCPVLATWDDHDFGKNDAGREYPKRKESQELFFEFWQEPLDSPRRKHEGVYEVQVFGSGDRSVQIILLDTRYFRSPLKKTDRPERPGDGHPGRYVPVEDAETTMLGEEQWKWLEQQLRVPARIRIIASSIQVISEEHGFEKWANFPRERQRLFDLIGATRAGGVLFISGDRHQAELSRLEAAPAGGAGYALYDLTSSALNQSTRWNNEINRHRIGLVYRDPNFGLIEIDCSAPDPLLTLQIRDAKGKMLIVYDAPIRELQQRAGS